MVFPTHCLKKYGPPEPNNKWLNLWDVPEELEIGVIPKRLFCNKDLVIPLGNVFKNLISSGYVKEMRTWDGCFNIRMQCGSNNQYSLHSWGVAVDINAAWNQFGKTPTLSAEFVNIWKKCGFDWGGDFGNNRIDGMHFQLKVI
jgi:hypothetical protein